jgi:hypothetical protein
MHGQQNIKLRQVLRILEESHEDGPVQQLNKINEEPNAVNTFLFSSVRFVSTLT